MVLGLIGASPSVYERANLLGVGQQSPDVTAGLPSYRIRKEGRMMMRGKCLSSVRLVLFASVLAPRMLWGASITLQPVLSGLSSPALVTNARDGSNRLFVLEQTGRIVVLQPEETSPTVFLDISSRTLVGGEQGLLGLAFHPQFAINRRFFVDYTRMLDGATVIAEYHVSATDPNLAEMEETVLLTIPQPDRAHKAGMLAFGPDGFLYIATGDGGADNDPDNRAQNVQELLGKILRIDVDHPQSVDTPYSSPDDNPFAHSSSGRSEIYAWGFRNPWRFSFDRATGQLYAGDVGQWDREEIDVVERGGNYGWRVMEGSHCTGLGPTSCETEGFISPLTEYDHTQTRCAIIGGYVYRGNIFSLPIGGYVYGDLCTGEIFLFKDGSSTALLDSDLFISSFGEDEVGELYVVGINDGTVYRLVNPDVLAGSVAVRALLESPAHEQAVSGVAMIRGWGVPTQDGDRISTISLFIDGVFSGNTPCCSERADVQAVFSNDPPANALYSGWGMVLNWGLLSEGRHTLRVDVQTVSGVVFSTPLYAVTVVKPGGAEFLDAFDLSGARARIEGEELVLEAVNIRDSAKQQQKEITDRFHWFSNLQ